MKLSPGIFKAYDIRGVVDDTLTEEAVYAIGQALALVIARAGESRCVVGRDGRLSGPRLVAALSRGLQSGGITVIDIGEVPTPVVYFATVQTGCGTGVAVTGSHNPPQYNGLKMMVAGTTLWGDAVQELQTLIVSGQAQGHSEKILANSAAQGGCVPMPEMATLYVDAVVRDIRLARPMRIAIDAGNGVAGGLAPQLLEAIGCQVQALYCEVDGHFPHHHPDPAQPENLQDLINAVKAGDAEVGLAFDGDGDRLGVVTRSGAIIWPDRQLMLYAQEVLKTHPGKPIIFDVKCSRHVARWIREHGGEPLMWKTGHSLIKAKLKETKAPLAGEMSGHIFFNDRWPGFDDGLYTAARLLEILSRESNPSALLESLPESRSTPELQLAVAEGENFRIVEQLRTQGVFPSATERILIDGIRVEYADGFGLARASNTTPVVVMRFEADNDAALSRIQAEFGDNLLRLMPGVQLPFAVAPHILVVKTSSMGDLVHMLSALQEACLHLPGLKIDWVAEESFADIARLLPAVHRVIPVAQRRWRRSLFSRATRSEIMRFVRSLRATQYDMVIDTQGLVKSAWITRLARCRPGGRWGYDRASVRESLAGWVLDHRVHAPVGWHAIERLRHVLASALGYSVQGPPRTLDFASRQLPKEPRTVLFLPGTSRAEKSWPAQSWIELGQHLSAQGYALAIARGSEAEHKLAQSIAMGIGDQARVLPRLSIAELAQMMPFCAGCVGVDSGLMHLSVALGCPTLAIMSGAHLPRFSAERFAPVWAGHARVLAATPSQPVITPHAAKTAWDALHA